jgi:hypothetical protein
MRGYINHVIIVTFETLWENGPVINCFCRLHADLQFKNPTPSKNKLGDIFTYYGHQHLFEGQATC